MKTKVLAISLIVLLTFVSFGTIITTKGAPGEGDWITNYSVEDPTTGQLMVEVNFDTGENQTLSSIFAGSELAITFTVDIPSTSPNTVLNLKTSMLHSQIEDVYWKLVSQDYDLIAYNPNSQDVSFYQTKGKLVLTLYGRVPVTAVRDIPVQYLIVTLYSSGQALDNIKVRVVTAAMDEFDTIYEQKAEKLQSLKDNGVAPGYIELYGNVLNESRVQAEQGNVESAIGMLNALSVSNEPASSAIEGLFLLLVLEDQIRDLEGLTLRASRVDRTISTSLESVKDRLKSIVGM
jgi:hypothetical protein